MSLIIRLLYVDPSGMVLVGAREYAATYGPGCTVTLDRTTGMVTVSWQNSSFQFSVSEDQYDDADWYIDDSLFVAAFGIGDVVLLVYVDSVTGNISIRANFNITGGIADVKFGEFTYRELFLKGIEDYWTGTFGEYRVATHTGESSNGITVKMYNLNDIIILPDGKEKIADGSFVLGFKDIYMVNGQDGSKYDEPWKFMWVSAHEFAHKLGIDDLYSYFPDSKGESSITNYPWGSFVSPSDIFRIIRAHRIGHVLKWSTNVNYPRSPYWRTK